MAITTSEARRDLFGLIERVNLDQTEVEITSKRGSAVLMSKDEFDALTETSYLLRSPKNAQRLLSALNSAREGKTIEHELSPAREDPVRTQNETLPE
jgi:antitoxin YefM